MITLREDVPHVAVLHVEYEVHEVLPSGELRGTPATKGKRTLKVAGLDRNICLRKLNELLDAHGLEK